MVELLQFLVMVAVPGFQRRLVSWLWRKPTTGSLPATALSGAVAGAVPGAIMDLCRSKQELMIENTLLRQQLIVLRRQVSRLKLTNTDRARLVLLAGRLGTWKSALLLVQPDTLLRWHRAGFRLFWRRKSRTISREPKLPTETIEFVQRMALEDRLWGAERIRGELLKLDIRVCKRTIQKYIRQSRKPGPGEGKSNQNWSTFLHNHAPQVGAADFLPVYDLFFRPLFIFFIIELGSRRVVHFGVTRSPTDEWTAQQLREATPFGEKPRFLIRDNDSKYAEKFTHVAVSSGIEVLRTPFKAPRANAHCERFVGTVRRECLDHVLILGERHLHRVIKEFVSYYNSARPHQGIAQQIPEVVHQSAGVEQNVWQVQAGPPSADWADGAGGKIISLAILGRVASRISKGSVTLGMLNDHQGATDELDSQHRVRAYENTAAYQKALAKRRVWVEPLFGEAKQWHGLERFRLRGLEKVNIESLLIASGQNLKWLLKKWGWGRRSGPNGVALAIGPGGRNLSIVGYQ